MINKLFCLDSIYYISDYNGNTAGMNCLKPISLVTSNKNCNLLIDTTKEDATLCSSCFRYPGITQSYTCCDLYSGVLLYASTHSSTSYSTVILYKRILTQPLTKYSQTRTEIRRVLTVSTKAHKRTHSLTTQTFSLL